MRRVLPIGWLFCLAAIATAAAPGPTSPGFGELIEQLGHPVYEHRLDARRRLLAEGLRAFDALRAAQEDPDPEIADASRRLLFELTADWSDPADPPAVRELAENYDLPRSGLRLDLIGGLAGIRGDLAIPALARLARFEPSDLAAREAARAVLRLTGERPDDGLNRRRQRTLAKAVDELESRYGPGRRPAAQWLRLATDELAADEPPVALWRRHAEAQLVLLDRQPVQTSIEVVATLQWRWLRAALAAGDDAAAAEAADGLVRLEEDAALERLARVVHWSAEYERWGLIDELTRRHAERLRSKRGLYLLAEAATRRGDDDNATRLAAEALAADPGEDDTSLEEVLLGPRVAIASELISAGRIDWAVDEYRAAAEAADTLDGQALYAAWRLNLLLFDAQRYEEAADALAKPVELISRSRPSRAEYGNLPQVQRGLLPDSGQFIARQRFSAALAARARDDREAELQGLRQAIAADPQDADVLIAMHRVADPPPDFVDNTLRRIDDKRREFERKIWERPQEADPYNQWAWLVGNTVGDYEKAVRYSRRSLELKPETAGYLDTLGQCLFAAGRIEEAVAVQRHAVELDPTTQVLRRQLAVFERALATAGSDEDAAGGEGPG